jgi:hypothetical protein
MVLRIANDKLWVVGLVSLFITLFGVITVTKAAIPDSETKVISACRDNTSGSLKVIDAENSGTCSGSETLLTWGGEQTAVVHIGNDSTSSFPFKYEPSFSRNVTSVAQSVGVGSLDGFCVDLPFVPLHSSDEETTFYQGNLELGQNVGDLCGTSPSYDAFIVGGVGSYFFTE